MAIKQRTRDFHVVGVLFAAVFLAAGCGDGRPARVPASGRVLIDGEPLEYGFVQVVPEGDRAATGQLGPGGRFTLTTFDNDDGVVPGKHKVAVIATESIDASSQRWHAPKKYMSTETSELEIEVTEPTDSLEVNLTWDGGQPFVERFQEE
jgi:hypothetical protein